MTSSGAGAEGRKPDASNRQIMGNGGAVIKKSPPILREERGGKQK